MKNYHKIFAVAVFGILIIPQITLAAWWNPMTWNWSALFNSSPQVQMATTTTSSDNFTSTSTTSTVATTSINIAATSTNTPSYQDLVAH